MEFKPDQWKAPNLVLSQELFTRLLELELKRGLRYQNFISLLLIESESAGERKVDRDEPRGQFEKMAQLLRRELRETDIVGTGDGNCAVILIHSDQHIAQRVGDRLLNWMSNYSLAAGASAKAHCCMGGACFPTHATDLAGLYQRAKMMLEKSKSEGGNRACILPP